MKATITKIRYVKQYTTKYGEMYLFGVSYDGKEGFYSCKSREQRKFSEGQEAEFSEIIQTNAKGEEWTTVKPIYTNTQSNFTRQLKKEQSRYSGFAMSYAKDLVVAGVIDINQISAYTKAMFELMVELDKTME